MVTTALQKALPRRASLPFMDGAVYLLLAAASAALWWLCRNVPTLLPVWAPWDFYPLEFVSFWLALWWFVRGLQLSSPGERPAKWRIACFVAGLALTYAVLMTRYDYLAQHMFFLNRFQHIVMHHLGPMLIVLGWPGATILRGMPGPLARLCRAHWLRRVMHVVQQPVLAAFLFVGLIYLWLIPDIHFRVMVDPRLYSVMNWSMVVDGILFWSLIFDPRPSPPARVGFLARSGILMGVMFPQILIGAFITFSTKDLYEFYHWCGRIYPSIDAMADQAYGGLIVWIPGAMMSAVGLLLVLNFMRLAEEEAESENEDETSPAIDAASWTGM